jgi:hypothetical protein
VKPCNISCDSGQYEDSGDDADNFQESFHEPGDEIKF